MERRLGRGLGALLPESGAKARGGGAEIELDSIRPNPFQPRVTFAAAGLEELRQSIVNHGILQPVVLRKVEEGQYELVSGERRWRASKLAGLRAIPAIIRPSVSDAEMLELALVENVQRHDLDPIEKARGYHQMMEQLQLTQEAVAERVGLKRSTVANHIRLLELPESIQEAVSQGALSMGHARALLSLQDRNRLLDMAANVVRNNLSVREVESLVRQEGQSPKAEKEGKVAEKKVVPAAPWVGELEKRMRDHLGAKVSLNNREGYKGQIVIDYFGREDLERLMRLLAPDASL